MDVSLPTLFSRSSIPKGESRGKANLIAEVDYLWSISTYHPHKKKSSEGRNRLRDKNGESKRGKELIKP